MIGKDTILIRNFHKVSSYTDCTKVEKRDKSGERNAIILGKSLHQFEAYTASAEMLEWI